MSFPVSLPFQVAPYPDELLGSWLFRLQAHNHYSMIAHLVNPFAQRKLDKAQWRDMVLPGVEFQRLMEALGTTHAAAMIERTTYPYWLRFHSPTRFEVARPYDHSEVPALIVRDRRETIPRLRFLLPNLVRICPVCLAENFAQHGEPYLHRAHHLPFVRTCHQHRIALISRCPKCNKLFRMKSTFAYARVTCSCGHDLRQVGTKKIPSQDSWERLALYSADALFSKDAVEECGRFYRFFDTRLIEQGVVNRSDFLAHLTCFYGSADSKALLTLAPQRSDVYTHTLIGSVSKQEFRAPQLCAFLATIDASFTQSLSRFSTFYEKEEVMTRDQITVRYSSTRPRIPRSISEARSYVADAELSAGKNFTRSFVYRRYKTLFWYLTLFDRKWFEKTYPPGKRGATEYLPSVKEDRLSILQAIRRAHRNSVRVWKNLAQQASFRASLRDTAWFEERKTETARKSYNDKLARKREHIAICEYEIEQALGQIQLGRGRTVSALLSEIAPYTRLNEDQLRHLFANNLSLRKRLLHASHETCDSDQLYRDIN